MKRENGHGEMAQWLRVLVTLAEDLDPSIHTCSSQLSAVPVTGDLSPSSGFLGHLCTYPYSHIYININE